VIVLRSRLTLFLVLVLAALSVTGLVACGGSDDDSSSSSDTQSHEMSSSEGSASTESGEEKDATADGDVAQVNIKDIKFNPEKLTVKVGQTIKWTNNDSIDHTVTATGGADFDSGVLKPGDTFEFTPEAAGTIDYECTIHAGQTGSIEVTE